MKKMILCMLVSLFAISCNVEKEKTDEEVLREKMSAYQTVLNTNAKLELTDRSALLSIELLSTEREYRDEVKKLVNENKLKYFNRTLVYDMGEVYSNPAYCEVVPKFHNNKLYQLVLKLELYNSNADFILGDLIRTSALKDMMGKSYGESDFYIYEKEYSDLLVSWIKDGKEVAVRNGAIRYTALKEKKEVEEEIEAESNIKAMEVIKGL